MSYQSCPHCRGTGTEFTYTINITTTTCSVCKGLKIISEVTGLPPLYEEPHNWSGDKKTN